MVSDRSTIDAARRAFSDVPRVLAMLGLDKGAQRQRDGALILCPWHEESTPSCSVTLGRDRTIRVRCFGCDASGDVLHLVAEAHGLTMPRDLRRVLEMLGAETPAPVRARPDRQAPPTITDDVFDAIASTALSLCPVEGPARAYLAERGVLGEAERAGWGSLPGLDGQRRVARQIVRTFGREAWLGSGLASKDGASFVWSDHALLIPYRAPGADGAIVTLQRRLARSPGSKREPKYVFPSGRTIPRWPFGGEALEELGPDTAVVFAEGAIDALTLRRVYRAENIDRAVLAIPSASMWRAEWASLAEGRLAIVATDADEEGDAVAERMAPDLFDGGALAVQRATPATAKDWAEEYAREALAS